MKTKSGVNLGISLPYSFPDARVDHVYIRRFVRQAEAGVATAQAAVDAARLDVEFTRVTAPVAVLRLSRPAGGRTC